MTSLCLSILNKAYNQTVVFGPWRLCLSGIDVESSSKKPFLLTRGVMLQPVDLTLRDWPQRAKRADLTTIELQPFPKLVMDFVRSEEGQKFLEKCKMLGLQVEYELHAMRELLPRELFNTDPSLYRMDEHGVRTPDANLCVSSEGALEIISRNALSISKVLHPTTGRYFFWGDDAQPYCHCPECGGLSESEQSLIVENRILETLHKMDPKAKVAHLAYARTLQPPKKIKPKRGIFLEYAPIQRRYDIPLASKDDRNQCRHLDLLDANLEFFGSDDAQVLEYWLDSSRFSGWKKPAVKVPFDSKVLASDLETYSSRGIRHITTHAVWIDAEYVEKYGDPPIGEYGSALLNCRPLT